MNEPQQTEEIKTAIKLYSDPAPPKIRRFLLDRLGDCIGLNYISEVHNGAVDIADGRHFSDRVLDVLNIHYEVQESDLARIPEKGPCIVVANHPFGGLEGIFLLSLLSALRPDTKLMANYMLNQLAAMKDSFLFVDPFGKSHSAKANLKSMKASLRWLKEGHVLGIFPAGEVAHYDVRKGYITEPEWSRTVAGLIRRTEVPVVPIFFEGTNSPVFHALGLLHPRMRTMMLPSQIKNKTGRKFAVHVGNAIPFKKLSGFETDEDIMYHLRMRTFNLRKRREHALKNMIRLPLQLNRKTTHLKPVIPAVPVSQLEQELRGLSAENRLVEGGRFEAWYARKEQIPHILQEIGRLREITFRAVGEGTGEEIDLDEYDDYYVHLFIWNPENSEIVGAYRLGATDEILPKYGKKGLYSNSLFRYRTKLLEHINPALEMGRSFVTRDYQRNYNSLLMLWKGIAQYVVRFPQYKNLFGPVSVNDHYKSSSRTLMVNFLKLNNYLPDMARMVRARTPLRLGPLNKIRQHKMKQVVDNIEDVESLIADIETELQGMPILLKQYLKLGGRLLGFNVDPKFSYVLDGLILVDLTQADEKVLSRYMTPEGLASFLNYHKSTANREKPDHE